VDHVNHDTLRKHVKWYSDPQQQPLSFIFFLWISFYRYHWISLLQKELSVSFQLSLKFFVCFCTWSEEDKMYYLSLKVTSLENDKSYMSSRVFTLQSLITFKGLSPSEFGPELQLLSNSKCCCICSFNTKTLFNTLNFSLWSCTLEHTLTSPIFCLRLCYHQNFRDIVQNPFYFSPLSLIETLPIHCHSFRINKKIDTIFNDVFGLSIW